VLERWRYLGTVRDAGDAEGLDVEAVPFDPDVYKILKRFLAAPAGARIIELG
jgi:hypothetical protein